MMKTNNNTKMLEVNNVIVHDYKSSPQLKNSRIMMVDDEPILLEIIQAFLEDAGYNNFIPVEHSSQSIDKIMETAPDLLLLDLEMPEIDGYEVLSMVRSNAEYERLPVIILTASSESEAKLKALELGATDFLSKPVDPSELVLRVRNTLSAKMYQDQLAYYDSVTGLPNQKMFIQRLGLGIELSKRENIPLMVLKIGLDKFRKINETLGMHIGDKVLVTIAERLNSIIRISNRDGYTDEAAQIERFARVGLNEFSIMLFGVNSEKNIDAISKRILDTIKQPVSINEHDIFITGSIGIAVCPTDGEDAESLIAHASSAKDYARKNGSDNYQFFSSEMDADSRERMKMESNIRKALDNNEFELYYQPKFNLLTNSLAGMECLLRWNQPEEGLIPPATFIPMAEELGLIVPIGEWILNEACLTMSEWVKSGHKNLKISVNVSAQQFNDRNLISSVETALLSSGLNPQNLILEITESMLMGDVENHISLLNQINDLGVPFSLDDFGTGYSSLSYLKKFPIDELKIDRSFLLNVPKSSEDSSIVKAIIAMAHSLGLKVVAEGVERDDQFEFLRQHNCNIVQGYYYSKPLNKADFTEYLQRHG